MWQEAGCHILQRVISKCVAVDGVLSAEGPSNRRSRSVYGESKKLVRTLQKMRPLKKKKMFILAATAPLQSMSWRSRAVKADLFTELSSTVWRERIKSSHRKQRNLSGSLPGFSASCRGLRHSLDVPRPQPSVDTPELADTAGRPLQTCPSKEMKMRG